MWSSTCVEISKMIAMWSSTFFLLSVFLPEDAFANLVGAKDALHHRAHFVGADRDPRRHHHHDNHHHHRRASELTQQFNQQDSSLNIQQKNERITRDETSKLRDHHQTHISGSSNGHHPSNSSHHHHHQNRNSN